MIDTSFSSLSIHLNEASISEIGKKLSKIMGQFIEYLSSMFTGKVGGNTEKNSNNHVTFADSSFAQAFNRSSIEQNAKLNTLRRSNRNTIYLYESIIAIACLVNFIFFTWPKLQVESFDFLEPEGWQLVTLSVVPIFAQLASLYAMFEINKPIPDGTKITSKNSGLELDSNEFIQSLKIMIVLIAFCQLSAVFADQLIWSGVVVVSIWCYLLTSRLATSEYNRHAPSPKKQWVKLNLSKSPKPASPTKSQNNMRKDDPQIRATPRTRTKRAVKNMMTGVSDKFHAFEQNVAHQFSQKIFTPLSPKMKMIES